MGKDINDLMREAGVAPGGLLSVVEADPYYVLGAFFASGGAARNSGFDLVGAVNAGALADTYIVARVTKVDAAKLAKAIGMDGGLKGVALTAGLSLVDRTPRAILDLAAPLVERKLREEIGITASIMTAPVPPPEGGRSPREFWYGAGVGGALVGVAWLLARLFGGSK